MLETKEPSTEEHCEWTLFFIATLLKIIEFGIGDKLIYEDWTIQYLSTIS